MIFGSKNQRAKGHILVDGEYVADTWQCVHCGGHFEVKRGSGNERGWCNKCGGPLCGNENCMRKCLPFEKQLELEEEKSTKLNIGHGVLRKVSIKDL